MKKTYLILLLLIAVVSISAVSATDSSINETQLSADVSGEVNEILADDNQNQNDLSALDNAGDSNQISQSNNPVNAVPSKVVTKNVKTTYGNKVNYTLKLLDKDNNPVQGKEVTFKINKNKYTRFTDSKGVATLTLNYKSGNYVIHYNACGLSGKNSYVVNNYVKLTVLKWGNVGDVSKAKLIRNNMPNNEWVKKAVKATKSGNPLLMIKGGEGKVIFITAGTHGNEISSQIAAMKLINKLTKNPIKGTVYIIPFVNLKAISKKVRYSGADFNRVAHKSGTISNRIVNLVAKYNCDAYGDFHTTQPGGAPGKNIVMGSKYPTISNKMAKYIFKKCGVNKIIYKYPGEKYPGAIADNVNKRGIPAVLCEVVLPHNTITKKSVKLSYSMMESLLKYNSVI